MKRPAIFALWFLPLAHGVLAGQSARPDRSVPLDLQAYTTELERWSASAGRLREHPQEAAALRQRLPESWPVTVQEQRFLVSTRPLGATLDRLIREPKSAAAASDEMAACVESMLRDSRAVARTSPPDYRSAHATLDDILKQREFRSVRGPGEGETFWDRFSDWLWEELGKILISASGHPRVTNFLLWGIVVILGLMFLAWLIYTLTHISYARFPARTEQPAAALPWMDWAQQARAAATRGEYREGIRIIYGAAVRRLGEKGAWQVDPARTHREYVRLLPADSLQRPPLVAITTSFEQVWYGHAPASASDYEAALAELESLQ